MTRYVRRPGHPQADEFNMVDAAIAGPKHASSDARFYVISDEMAPTRHMADNRMFTSKRAFRDNTRAHGCVEVGNDPALMRPRKPITLSRQDRVDAIKQSIEQLRSRR